MTNTAQTEYEHEAKLIEDLNDLLEAGFIQFVGFKDNGMPHFRPLGMPDDE